MAEHENPFQSFIDSWTTAQADFMSAMKPEAAAQTQTQGDIFAPLRQQAEAFLGSLAGSAAMPKDVASAFDPAAMFGLPAFKSSPFGSGAMPGFGANTMGGMAGNMGNPWAWFGAQDAAKSEATSEWQSFEKSLASYQSIIADAWKQALDEFPGAPNAGEPPSWDGLSEAWLKHLDDTLKSAMKSEPFVEAQAALTAAGAAFKSKEREMVEAWCKANDVPTRGELDAVYEELAALRRELEALKTK